MMKSRIAIAAAVGLLILGAALFAFFTSIQPQEQIIPAAINRDCAPWDGAAFTVSIPVENGMIHISIWKSPDIKLPVTYSFPDRTGTIGNALLRLPGGVSEALSGRVAFQGVTQEGPVEGRFDLVSETGRKYA